MTLSPSALAIHTFLARQFILTKQAVALSKRDALLIDPTLRGGDYVRAMHQLDACGAVERTIRHGKNHFTPCWVTPTTTMPWTTDAKARFGRPAGHYTPIERSLFDTFLGCYTPGVRSRIVRYTSVPLLSFKDIGIYIINCQHQRTGLPPFTPRRYRTAYDLSRLIRAGLLDDQGRVYPVPSRDAVLASVAQLAFGRDNTPPVLSPLGLQALGMTKNARFQETPSPLDAAAQDSGTAHPLFFVPPGMIDCGSIGGPESMIDSGSAIHAGFAPSGRHEGAAGNGRDSAPWTHGYSWTQEKPTPPALRNAADGGANEAVKVPLAIADAYRAMNHHRAIVDGEWAALCHLADLAGGWETIGAIVQAAARRRKGPPTTLTLPYVATSMAERLQEADSAGLVAAPVGAATEASLPRATPARRRRAAPPAETIVDPETVGYLREKGVFAAREFAHLPCEAVRDYVESRLATQVPIGVIVQEMRQAPPMYTAAELKAQAEAARVVAEAERDARLRAEEAAQEAEDARMRAWADRLEAEAESMQVACEHDGVQCLPDPQEATAQLREVLGAAGMPADLLLEVTVVAIDQTLSSAYALLGVVSERAADTVGRQWRAVIIQWIADAGGYDLTAPQTSRYPAQWVGIGVCRLDRAVADDQLQTCPEERHPASGGEDVQPAHVAVQVRRAPASRDGGSTQPDAPALVEDAGTALARATRPHGDDPAHGQPGDDLPATLGDLCPAVKVALLARSRTPGSQALARIAAALTDITILRQDGDQLRELTPATAADDPVWRPEGGDVVVLATTSTAVHQVMDASAAVIAEILGLLLDRRPESLSIAYRQQRSTPRRTAPKVPRPYSPVLPVQDVYVLRE
jgi:hypothetical protein